MNFIFLLMICASRLAHPGGDALVHATLEGGAEGAVAVVAALQGQLLGADRFLCSGKLAVAGYEVTDAKVVDVFIVACILAGEILAQNPTFHKKKNPVCLLSSFNQSASLTKYRT